MIALVRLAQTVDLQRHFGKSNLFPQGAGHQYQLSVDFAARKAKCLGPNLVKLPVTAALWTFVAKHRTHVIQPFAAVVQKRVLDDRAEQRPQCSPDGKSIARR